MKTAVITFRKDGGKATLGGHLGVGTVGRRLVRMK